MISIDEARKHLGELLNEAYYLGKPFVLKRGKKPMAALIGTHIFGEMLRVIEKYDPGLADTLAIMANPEVQAILEEDEKNLKEGKTIPFGKWLVDD